MCRKFGENGNLDFTTDKIPKRFENYIKEIKDHLSFSLQPMTTSTERDVLLRISKCKNCSDLTTLLMDENLDSGCRYLCLAVANETELRSSGQLLSNDHNESWYRSHVYASMCDNVFMYDNHFNSKRSECYANITKEFKDVNNQLVDFNLRNINDDIDYLSVEEKPSLKGVKSDLKKGETLQHKLLL